jgi:hypothetical protein
MDLPGNVSTRAGRQIGFYNTGIYPMYADINAFFGSKGYSTG